MSTTTEKLGLILPGAADYVDVNDLNSNFEKIDDSAGWAFEPYGHSEVKAPSINARSWVTVANLSVTLEPGTYLVISAASLRLASAGMATIRLNADEQTRQTIYNDGDNVSSCTLIQILRVQSTTNVGMQVWSTSKTDALSSNYDKITAYRLF